MDHEDLNMDTRKESIPSLQEQELFYNEYWSRHRPYGRFKTARVARIIEYLSEIKKKRIGSEILDLGCGDGRSVPIWNVFGRATGIDLSAAAVEQAGRNFPGLKFVCGDAVHSPFEDNSFDIVISQEVVEHIENQTAYVDECHRLLRKDGYLVLTTPNKYYFDNLKGGNYSKQPIEKIMTSAELHRLLKNKFQVIRMESVVIAPADFGIYRFFYSRIIINLFKLLKMDFLRRELIRRNLLGVHLCVLACPK